MDENPRKLGARAVEGDAPLAQKRSGVQRAVPRRARQPQRRTLRGRNAAHDPAYLRLQPGIVDEEQISG